MICGQQHYQLVQLQQDQTSCAASSGLFDFPLSSTSSAPIHQQTILSSNNFTDNNYIFNYNNYSIPSSTFYFDNTQESSPTSSLSPSDISLDHLILEPSTTSTSIPTTIAYSHLLHSGTASYASMNQAQFHTLATPQFQLQRPSEPASPATVASSASQLSTPSRSPSRVSILSDSNPDWVLFDESMGSLAQEQPKDRSLTGFPHHARPFHNNINNTNTNNYQQTRFNSYQMPINTAAFQQNTYYPGVSSTTNYSKFAQNNFLNPHSGFQTVTEEDELPELSPSGQNSGRPSISESETQPMTPATSPRVHAEEKLQIIHTPTIQITNPIPKFVRTVSDAVEDELFRPVTFDSPSTPQRSANTSSTIPPNLATYIKKAQNDHARNSSPNNLNISRDKSPFRANSPFHPMRTPQTVQPAPVRHSNLLPQGFVTARSQREQQQELEAQHISQQIMNEANQVLATPKTISPKDAVLEYPEPEDEGSRASLFAHEQNGSSFNSDNSLQQVGSMSTSSYTGSDLGDNVSEQDYNGFSSRRSSDAGSSVASVGGAFSYHPNPQLALLPPGYPYLQSLPLPDLSETALNAYLEEVNQQAQNQQSQQESKPRLQKPKGAKADTGAYTCTADGCNQRFQTNAKLQKHRKINHPETPRNPGDPVQVHIPLSRQPGPHRCTRLNPATGKPCNTVFSRPYDLTRHEDTIHNSHREKVRCEICNDEKRFSRLDALTRHKKVKHGIDSK